MVSVMQDDNQLVYGSPGQRQAALVAEPGEIDFVVVREGTEGLYAGAGGTLHRDTPAEVATMFRVDPKTVTRWAKSGKLSSIRTLGGHRRYRATEVRQLLDERLQPELEALGSVDEGRTLATLEVLQCEPLDGRDRRNHDRHHGNAPAP